MRTLRVLVSLALTVFLSAECAGEDTSGDEAAPADGEVHELAIGARDNEFVPTAVEVAAGQVELTVDNNGDAVHNVVNEELGVVAEAEGGEQATTTFTAEPGTYELVCTYHRSQGMTATLTVSD